MKPDQLTQDLAMIGRNAIDALIAADKKREDAPTNSADVIAGLEMAIAQAAAMIERQRHVMQRAMDAWDATTHQKNGDGRLWQCMEELRGECWKAE